MYDISHFIGSILGMLFSIFLIVLCCVLFVNVLNPYFSEIEAQDNAYAGEVVDKKIINAHSGLFASSDIDYRLIIKVEYEWKGKIKETEKSISVDKETYQQADIGDWFDSHTLEVTKPE